MMETGDITEQDLQELFETLRQQGEMEVAEGRHTRFREIAKRILIGLDEKTLLEILIGVLGSSAPDPRIVEKIMALATRHSPKRQASSGGETEASEEVLALYIKPGTAPPEEIAAFLDQLSKLYEMIGGAGIVFRLDEVSVPSANSVGA